MYKRHEAGEQPRPAVVEAARRQADDNADGFTLIKIRLRECLFKVHKGFKSSKVRNRTPRRIRLNP